MTPAIRRAIDLAKVAPFSIPCAGSALQAVRVSLALVVATWVVCGPFPDMYPAERALLYRPAGLATLIPSLDEAAFCFLRMVVVAACVGMLSRRTAYVATIIAAAAFAVLNGFVSGFGPVWNYDAHLNLFLVALCFARPGVIVPQSHARNSAVLFSMRFYVAVIYLQAGLAKLLHGGWKWAFSTPYVHLMLMDGPGRLLLSGHPWIVACFGNLVLLAELGLPILLLARRTVLLGVLLATALHLAFYVALGISFWHLWLLFPALFLWGDRLSLATLAAWRGKEPSALWRRTSAGSSPALR